MSNRLIEWNTGRLIAAQLNKLKFLQNYEAINKDLYDMYVHIKDYADSAYNGKASISYNNDLYDSLVKHLDNMVEFQRMVDSKDESLDLAKEAKERFDNEHVRSAVSIDRLEIARLELLLEYAEPIRILFNNLLSLVESTARVPSELVAEIQEVLLNKGLDHFDIPDELLITNTVNQDV